MKRQRYRQAVLAEVLLLAGLCFLPGSSAAFTATTSTGGFLSASQSFYQSSVLQDNPKGYWRLDEPTGAGPAADVSGNAHPGTMRGGSLLGQAGTTNDASTSARGQRWGQASVPRLVQDDFTLEVWFKSDGNGFSGYLLGADAPGNANDFSIYLNSNGTVVASTGSASPASTTYLTSPTGTNYSDMAWHLVDFTRVRSTGAMSLYVDGALVASGTGSVASLAASSVIGIGVDDDGVNARKGILTGSFDEAAQYPVALSATRISAHYSARSGANYPTTVGADSPSGYWRLNDSGSSLVPTIGNSQATGAIGADARKMVAGAVSDGDKALAVGVPGTDNAIKASVPRLVGNDFSLEAWFRTTENFGSQGAWYSGETIIGSDVAGVKNDYGVSIAGNGKIMAGVGGTADYSIISGGSLTYNDGQWHQVIFTRSATTSALQLYADGVLVASGTATGGNASLTAATDLGLGSSQPTAGSTPAGLYVGAIDNVSQYPTVLSATQVAAHYAARTSAASYKASVLADSPAGYWDLEDTSGTVLLASAGGTSANGYVGTGVQRSLAGAVGEHALGFSRNIIDSTTGILVPRLVSDDFTLECWFKTLSGGAGPSWMNGSPLVQGDSTVSNANFGLALIYGGRVAFGADSAANAVQSDPGLADGAWHHVVVTRVKSTGSINLFVDGSLKDTATGSTTSLTASAQLGIISSVTSFPYLDGYVDDVAVYDYVLPTPRIGEHFHRGQP